MSRLQIRKCGPRSKQWSLRRHMWPSRRTSRNPSCVGTSCSRPRDRRKHYNCATSSTNFLTIRRSPWPSTKHSLDWQDTSSTCPTWRNWGTSERTCCKSSWRCPRSSWSFRTIGNQLNCCNACSWCQRLGNIVCSCVPRVELGKNP